MSQNNSSGAPGAGVAPGLLGLFLSLGGRSFSSDIRALSETLSNNGDFNRSGRAFLRRAPPISPASHTALLFGYSFLNPRAGLVAFQKFAALRGRKSFFHFLDEPPVVIDHAFHGFRHPRLAIASLLRGKTIQFGLQFRRKSYDHAASLGAAPGTVKPFATMSRGGTETYSRRNRTPRPTLSTRGRGTRRDRWVFEICQFVSYRLAGAGRRRI
jgi:hypothetical protein